MCAVIFIRERAPRTLKQRRPPRKLLMSRANCRPIVADILCDVSPVDKNQIKALYPARHLLRLLLLAQSPIVFFSNIVVL